MYKLLVVLSVYTISHLASSEEVAPRVLRPIQARFAPSKARIIGGEEVKPHSIPYQAALYINGDAYCGGALISPNYVLTAAHCGVVIEDVEVILGAHNLSDPDEETQVRIKGEKIIINANYVKDTLEHDIALIELSEAAPISDVINVVPLPASNTSTESYLDEVATVSGWGLYKDVPQPTIKSMSDVLKKVDVTVFNLTECMEFYNMIEGGDRVYETSICTSGEGNKGICGEDSGGPLVLNGTLIGLTSFTTDLCEACSPSVYTKVVDYLEWIADNSDVNFFRK